jgi:hypothetical protein
MFFFWPFLFDLCYVCETFCVKSVLCAVAFKIYVTGTRAYHLFLFGSLPFLRSSSNVLVYFMSLTNLNAFKSTSYVRLLKIKRVADWWSRDFFNFYFSKLSNGLMYPFSFTLFLAYISHVPYILCTFLRPSALPSVLSTYESLALAVDKNR